MSMDPIVREGRRWDERLAAAVGFDHSPAAVDDSCLAAWRRAVDTDDAGLFAKRLAWGGLTMADAVAVVEGLPEADDADPPWWPTLVRLQDACRAAADGEVLLPEVADAIAFAHLLWPVVDDAWRHLTAELPPEVAALFSEDAAGDARLALLVRLSGLVSRPLMTQFGADRTPGTALMLALGAGGDGIGRESYEAFCRMQAAAGLAPLLVPFPVLGRLLAVTCEAWQRSLSEMALRLHHDAHDISTTFDVSEPLRIETLSLGEGDSHRGGRSVAIVSLAAEQGPVRIVYKPKDMRIEQQYQALVTDSLHGPDAVPGVSVLPVGDHYGYVSFVAHRPVDEGRLDDFYRHAGALLALLHLLGATDCHFENLIADGTDLVLIDPETLFEGRVRPLPGFEDLEPSEPREDSRDLMESVLRTGMLPSWTRDGLAARAYDISALGMEHPAELMMQAHGWVGVNTDGMAWGRISIPATRVTSLPVAPGVANPLPAHVDALAAGFADGYRRIMDPTTRERLLQRVSAFAGVRRRIVLRATRTYAILQQRALTPDALASANVRAFEFERLGRSSLVGSAPTHHWQFFQAELHDMESLDIPYFDYPLGSTDVHGTDRVISNVLTDDGLAQATDRITSASESDLAWQVELLRASVGARQHRSSGFRPSSAQLRPGELPAPVRDSDRLDAITGIVDLIERSALRDPTGRRTWLSLMPIGDGMQVQLGLIDGGLYGGRSGLAAFLSAVARDFPRPDVAERAAVLAEEALAPVSEDLTRADGYTAFRLLRDSGLGMSGAGGILRVLALPDLPMSADMRGRVREIIVEAMLDGLVAKDVVLDLIGGSAGSVAPLVTQFALRPDDRLAGAIREIAEHLIARQDPLTGGWVTTIAWHPLAGISHGASGIGLALLLAGSTLGDDRLVEAGARGFAYERSILDEQAGNWPDLRDENEGSGFMTAWCHGAPGIALARMRALQVAGEHPDADGWRDDLRIAVATTAAAPANGLDHLCCGGVGRAVVLDAVGRWTGDEATIAAGAAITADVMAHWMSTGDFRLNDMGTGSSAGATAFMTGASGIGMHLLGQEASAELLALLT